MSHPHQPHHNLSIWRKGEQDDYPQYTIVTESPPNATAKEQPSYNWPVLCFFTIVVLAMAGNVLVCLAVKFERKLQNMFNYFLVSLALSDMLSATLVMPLSIIKAFIDELPVPKLMCVAWYSLDVLFTSSTIIHLCMISIDRYMSLKYPLKYGHAKKTKHTVMKIVIVWILSFSIAGPLFLFSMFDNQEDVYYKGCGPETTTFVLSATISSFYLPLFIMTIMYILTVKALHAQRKTQQRLAVNNCAASSLSLKEQVPIMSPKRKSLPKQASAESRDSAAGGRSPLLGHKLFKSPDASPTSSQRNNSFLCVDTDNGRGLTPSSTCTDIALQDFDNTSDSHGGPTHSSSTRRVKKVFRLRRENGGSSTRSSLDKGRRAVQVLGILFAVFVVFYLPFFATYTINATCTKCQAFISPQMIMAFEWLAYSGSMVNPIIYHIFNPDFRRAFHKILHCKCSRSRPTHLTYTTQYYP
uniref:Orphan G-protein coupled receptor 55 n=1 Tax=Platynereis dumerilii TaxID=6359 RepID=A0A0K0PUK1_PLADU|nr:orphan G-protein coupled receptor 55 [Platynereis dumerilii]